ncbi:hypothetical protein [Streptacidiphilus rugosus]|uniref:hypothetical protein n=1 Tax=Streptacidiphilus rugosus TaxID=405783 RepID=UPI0012FADB8D|nr:hypothetical protein [Streptacidiphilus rugosus]
MRIFTRSRKAAAARVICAVGLTAGALLSAGGNAQAATTYWGNTAACRGNTAPGVYPYGIQLNPCFDSVQETSRFWGGGSAYSPSTAIHLYTQTGWKYLGSNGSPVPGEPNWDSSVSDWGDFQGSFAKAINITDEFGEVVTPGYCYYTKMWFTESGHVYGPAESPGDCFR